MDVTAHDDRVEAVWPRYVTADDQFLPTVHAVFDPRAGAFPWLIKAVFTLPDMKTDGRIGEKFFERPEDRANGAL